VAGPAFTVQGAGGDNLALHHAVLAAPAGHVLVVDAGGAPFGHWGEDLTVTAQQRDIAGLVIDGAVRDVDMAHWSRFLARHDSGRPASYRGLSASASRLEACRSTTTWSWRRRRVM
jgi:hypothetical protein